MPARAQEIPQHIQDSSSSLRVRHWEDTGLLPGGMEEVRRQMGELDL